RLPARAGVRGLLRIDRPLARGPAPRRLLVPRPVRGRGFLHLPPPRANPSGRAGRPLGRPPPIPARPAARPEPRTRRFPPRAMGGPTAPRMAGGPLAPRRTEPRPSCPPLPPPVRRPPPP